MSGYHRFPAALLLDVDPRDTVVNIVKSKLLERLDHDVPYALQPKLEHWEVRGRFIPTTIFSIDELIFWSENIFVDY